MTAPADPAPPPGRRAAFAARWAALPANTRGAVWVLIACFGFTVMAAMAKALGQRLDSFQVAFFRCVFGFAFLLPFLIRAGGLTALRTRVPYLHGGRALTGVVAMMCGFYAITHLPLATATAITFTKPFFMIVLAVLFLGEAVRWRRWSATAAGFVGVLIIVRPGTGMFEPAMLVAVLQALAIACSVTLVKKIPIEEPHVTVLFYTAIVSTVVTAIPAAVVWQPPSAEDWVLAVLIGGVGVASQACVVRGYRIGEATAMAPFDYSRLLFATGFGFLFFLEVPDLMTFVGAGIIIASTVYIARREARLGTAKAGPAEH